MIGVGVARMAAGRAQRIPACCHELLGCQGMVLLSLCSCGGPVEVAMWMVASKVLMAAGAMMRLAGWQILDFGNNKSCPFLRRAGRMPASNLAAWRQTSPSGSEMRHPPSSIHAETPSVMCRSNDSSRHVHKLNHSSGCCLLLCTSSTLAWEQPGSLAAAAMGLCAAQAWDSGGPLQSCMPV